MTTPRIEPCNTQRTVEGREGYQKYDTMEEGGDAVYLGESGLVRRDGHEAGGGCGGRRRGAGGGGDVRKREAVQGCQRQGERSPAFQRLPCSQASTVFYVTVFYPCTGFSAIQ